VYCWVNEPNALRGCGSTSKAIWNVWYSVGLGKCCWVVGSSCSMRLVFAFAIAFNA
jgi:hypothetical protein